MSIYLFEQHNSGGVFHCNDKICHRVFIEAYDLDGAIDFATDIGIYFDGCDIGADCPCCGDRWYRPFDTDELVFPIKYSKEIIFETVEEYAQYLADKYGWTKPDGRIYFANGDVVEIFSTKG